MIGPADPTQPSTRAADTDAPAAVPTVTDLAAARGDVYATFAALFLFPEDDRVCSLRDAVPELQSLLGLFPAMVHFRVLDQLCRTLAGLSATDLAGLNEVYTSLFLSGAGPLACPPCASAYLCRGQDAGWVSTALDGTYARAALQAGHDLSPDHVAVELDFLAFLCAEEASCWAAGDATAAVRLLRREGMFIKQHLDWWFERFATRLARVDPLGLHATAANSAATFLAHDVNLIDGLLIYYRGAGERIAR